MALGPNDITRRRFLRDGSFVLGGLTLGPALLGGSGCRCGAGEATGGGDGGAAGPVPEAFRDFDVRFALRDHLHLADVDHHGQYLEFGSAARFKYTLGGWRSGWGADVEEQGTTFTWATASPARVYFHLEQATPFTLIFRARRGAADRFSVYVNDQPLTRVDLSEGWSEQRVAVDVAKARAGENSLKLVHSGRDEGTNAFALDSIRVVPGAGEPATGGDFVAPTADSLLRSVSVGGQERPSIVLRTPARLAWFVQVPEGASLGLGSGLVEGSSAVVRVHATDASTGRAERLHRVELAQSGAGAGWRDDVVDLGAYGGKVARIEVDVEAEGGVAEVALAAPAILARRASVEAAGEPVRNVVVLLIDTLRADHLSSYARTRVRGAQMDRFVREATLFERCQAQANWTKPSCASVLTGLHPSTHRALTEAGTLARSARMVSEVFQAAGFSTAAFIANGYLAGEFGFNRGWSFYKNHIRERVPTEAEHVFGDALRWIEENRESRFFTYIQTIDPHVPYDPPEEDLRLYDPDPYSGPVSPRSTGNLLEDFKRERVALNARDRARLKALYDGEVTYHDRCFGQFLDRLRELGHLDDTLVVVTADHGEEFFEHDSVGHGHSLFQELVHVPLIVRAPGLAQPGRRLSQVVETTDIVPTILEATGVEVPAEVEGRSLVAELRGAPAPVLSAGFSSQWDTGNDRELAWTVRVGDWKLRMHGPAISYLYDLSRDAGETNDVDEASPIALRALRVVLGQFLGAPAKRSWAAASAERAAVRVESEQADMTPEMCEQLRALGYLNVESCQ